MLVIVPPLCGTRCRTMGQAVKAIIELARGLSVVVAGLVALWAKDEVGEFKVVEKVVKADRLMAGLVSAFQQFRLTRLLQRP